MKKLVMLMAVFTTASVFAGEPSKPSKEVKSQNSEEAIYCKVKTPEGMEVECYFCNCGGLANSL